MEQEVDPRNYPVHNSAVIAYRLSILETDVSSMDKKLDTVIAHYPSKEILQLILDPLKSDVKDITQRFDNYLKGKEAEKQQIKYLTYAAIIGPIISLVVSLVIAGVTVR